jgi:hypothetical protein
MRTSRLAEVEVEAEEPAVAEVTETVVAVVVVAPPPA